MRPRRLLVLLGLAACAGPRALPEPSLALSSGAEVVHAGLVSTAGFEVRLAISPDGRRMLWGVLEAPGGPGGWEIVESVRTDAGWSAARPVPFDTPANEFDPAFAPDGRSAVFFSNRPGGTGGDDLYSVPLNPETGAWGTATSLGSEVNTPGDEWAPGFSPDGQTLLFASDGLGGAGRHDLFVSERDGDGWGAARPLGGGASTPADDFDATFLPDGRTVVLTSGDLEAPDLALFAVTWDGRRASARTRLGAAVNEGTFTLGPSTSTAEPGWLYFSAGRAGGPGRADIYRVRYR